MTRAIGDDSRALLLRTLAGVSAFKDVAAPTLATLAELAQTVRARRGKSVYDAGEAWASLGLVLEGTLAMLASEGGERQHLYEQMGAGSFFGVSAVFDGEPEMANTIVLSQTATFAWIPRSVVLELCRKDPALAFALATVIARRLRNVTALLAEQLNLSTRERVARFLLNFAEGNGMRSALDPLPAMTQAQIAAAAGTVKEVVARVIAEFESSDALRRERGHIRYLNRQRLIQLSVADRRKPAATPALSGRSQPDRG